MEKEITGVQDSFRKCQRTQNIIADKDWITEKAKEKLLYGYGKAFDHVDHVGLWNVLREIGISEHLIVLKRNLYIAT